MIETQDDGAFNHDEVDITMASYGLKTASNEKSMILELTGDTQICFGKI